MVKTQVLLSPASDWTRPANIVVSKLLVGLAVSITSYRHHRDDVTELMCQAPHNAPGRTLQLNRRLDSPVERREIKLHLIPVMTTVVPPRLYFYLQPEENVRELQPDQGIVTVVMPRTPPR